MRDLTAFADAAKRSSCGSWRRSSSVRYANQRNGEELEELDDDDDELLDDEDLDDLDDEDEEEDDDAEFDLVASANS